MNVSQQLLKKLLGSISFFVSYHPCSLRTLELIWILKNSWQNTIARSKAAVPWRDYYTYSSFTLQLTGICSANGHGATYLHSARLSSCVHVLISCLRLKQISSIRKYAIKLGWTQLSDQSHETTEFSNIWRRTSQTCDHSKDAPPTDYTARS